MKGTEVQQLFYDEGWTGSKLVEALKRDSKASRFADKRQVSDTLTGRRPNPVLQERMSKLIGMDAEIVFGNGHWKNLLKDK